MGWVARQFHVLFLIRNGFPKPGLYVLEVRFSSFRAHLKACEIKFDVLAFKKMQVSLSCQIGIMRPAAPLAAFYVCFNFSALQAWSCPVWRSLGPFSSMSTLLLFCRLYNHIQQPSKLGFGCDYCLFKVSFGVLFYRESAAAFIVCGDINTRLVSLSESGSRTSLPPKVSACLCSFSRSLCVSTLVVRRRQTQNDTRQWKV